MSLTRSSHRRCVDQHISPVRTVQTHIPVAIEAVESVAAAVDDEAAHGVHAAQAVVGRETAELETNEMKSMRCKTTVIDRDPAQFNGAILLVQYEKNLPHRFSP